MDADSQANATSSLGIDKQREAPSIYDVLLSEPGDDMSAGEAILTIDRPAFGAGSTCCRRRWTWRAPRWSLRPRSKGSREYKLRNALAPLRERYDYILVDCPPSLGLLTLNALSAADAVIIPLQCEYLALEGLMQLTSTISLVLKGLNRSLRILGIAMTMYDSRTNLSAQVVEEVKSHFPREVFTTLVPRSVRLSEAPSYGLTILEYDPTSRGAVAYAALAGEVVARSGEEYA